ncbi:nucleotidyl transferase AbiEii/AbiGii toxin family protein [Nocardia sp. NPDC050193]
MRLAIDSENTWVLKGGAALEFRLYPRARATKDIDLAVAAGQIAGHTVRELLIDAMADDADQDWFTFQVSQPTSLRADAGGREAWRFSVNAFLGGKSFAGVRLDVADRHAELAATEQLELPGMLQFAGIPPRAIEAVDRNQHFAEKLHAFTKDYGARPNTRVKDLVDLVLLIEDGLQPNAELVAVAQHVFAIRKTHPVPHHLPDPPPLWRGQYPLAAAGLTDIEPDLAAALGVVRAFWTAAVDTSTRTE